MSSDKIKHSASTESIRRFVRFKTSGLMRMILGTENWFQYSTQLRATVQRWQYRAPASPYKTIDINPSQLEYYNAHMPKRHGLGMILGGTWDKKDYCNKIKETHTFRGLKQRFEKQYEWEDTSYYKKAKKDFNQGKNTWGYENIQDFVDVRCRYVDKLYQDICEEGYKIKESGPDTPHEGNKRTMVTHKLEPLVLITRNGDIHLRDGFHRVVIADILNISQIPVHVVARHKKWQKYRDEVSSSTRTFEDTHPDLVDIQ